MRRLASINGHTLMVWYIDVGCVYVVDGVYRYYSMEATAKALGISVTRLKEELK